MFFFFVFCFTRSITSAKLANYWFYKKIATTKFMKSGTLNEANLIKHLIDCNYVKFIAEVGLVDHNQHVGISVSADGVCTDGNNSNMPLEVKTCIGEEIIFLRHIHI